MTLAGDKSSAEIASSTTADENLVVENVNLSMRDGTLSVAVSDGNKESSVEPANHNPHDFESQKLAKDSPAQTHEEVRVDVSDHGDAVAIDYQSLSVTAMDYVSVYSVPGKGREGRDIIPKVEVGGKFYTVVKKDKTEQHVYTSLAK